MVPKLVQNWRRLQYGNFIGFQSEMIRNIYQGLSYEKLIILDIMSL